MLYQNHIQIVETILFRTIGPQIVQQLKERGVAAASLHGKNVFTAKKRMSVSSTGQKVSLGFVGDINRVNKNSIQSLLKKDIVPVIAPLAAGGGTSLNINADIAAAHVAAEMKASHLIFLSDVNGLLEDVQHPDSTITKISQADVQGLINTGVIHSGMLPKIQSAIDALKNGVRRVKMLNGQIAHCILVDLFLDPKIGTEITSSA